MQQLTTILLRAALTLIILLLYKTTHAQKTWTIDQTRTEVEILDTTNKIQLEQMAEVFVTDTAHFPKTYFTARHHVEMDDYEMQVHDLKTKKSFRKLQTAFSKLRGNKTSEYWDSDTSSFLLVESGKVDSIHGFSCKEIILQTKQDTMSLWVADKLPFIRYSEELPWGLEGFVMRYDSKWNPYSKKPDVRLTFHVDRHRITEDLRKYMNMTSNPSLYDQPGQENASCDTLSTKQLPTISPQLAARINEIVLPWQTRYKPLVHQYFELDYSQQPIQSYKKIKWEKERELYTLNGNKLQLIQGAQYRTREKYKIKLGKDGQIKKLKDSLDKIHVDNGVIKRKRFEKVEMGFYDSYYYDAETRTYVACVLKRNFSARKLRKPRQKKYNILQFNQDSTVSHRGESVVPLSTTLTKASECKKYWSYKYDEGKKLISIYNEGEEKLEHEFCYFNNGLLKGRFSHDKQEYSGDGYVYFDYIINEKSGDQTEVEIIETWITPTQSEMVRSYTFDKHNNLIYFRNYNQSDEDAEKFEIEYK